MTPNIKWLLVLSTSFFSFVMALTSPTINLYYMKVVTPQVYTSAQTISTLSAALMTAFLTKQSNRDRLKVWFAPVLIVDSVGFFALSWLGTLNPNIRFIGFSILFSTTMTVWSTIMLGAINNALSSEELTDFQTLSRAWGLWFTVAGGLLAIALISRLSLNQALLGQCVANAISAICDCRAFNRLGK